MPFLDDLVKYIDETIEKRLRRSGINDSGITGGHVTGPVPGSALPSHDHTGASASGGKLTNPVIDNYVQMESISTPSAAASDQMRLYSKLVASKAKPHYVDEDGTEFLIASGITGTGQVVTINFVIDGGGDAITAGTKGYLVVDFACTINQVTVVSDLTGSIVIDIEKSTYSGFPTTSSIAASAKPTLSSARKSQDTTLTGWTTSIAAGDVLFFEVDSASTVTKVTVALKVTRV